MTQRTISVAAVGAGAWGFNIVRTLGNLEVLGAVIEADTSKHAKVRELFPNVPCFTDWPESLGRINAVAIATPAHTHFRVAKRALEQGLDVFVEKPITLCAEQAATLEQISGKGGNILMVGHLLLYQPAVRWISSYLREGGLGRVFSVHQERLNLGRVRSVEDALWSLGVHDIAVQLSWLESRPQKIVVSKQAVLQESIADDVYLHLHFENGIHSHLHVSWLWPEKRRQSWILGEKGMLQFDENTQTVYLHKKTFAAPSFTPADGGVEKVFQQVGEPLRLEMEHFIDCCMTRRAPLSDASSAREVVRVLEAASQAVAN